MRLHFKSHSYVLKKNYQIFLQALQKELSNRSQMIVNAKDMHAGNRTFILHVTIHFLIKLQAYQ